MKYCKYHPLSAATHHCLNCETTYCNDCSDESAYRDNEQFALRCFVCDSALEQLRDDSTIPPFWRNLMAVYRYPIGISAMIAIFGMSFFSAMWMSFGLLQFLPSICITLYCFACLRETASGNLKAPSFSECFSGALNPIFSIIFMCGLALLATHFVSIVFGAGASLLMICFFVLTLPAAIMVLAIEERLLPALDPGRLIDLIKATGTSYFVMLLFLIIMISSVGILESFVNRSETSFTGVFFQSAISNYYFIVEFHVLGYLVHQNQHRLGISHSFHDPGAQIRSENEWLNAKIGTLIKAGQYDGACKFSQQQVDQNDAQMWQWARCFKLMCVSRNERGLKGFVPRYFDKLLALQRGDDVADAYMMLKKTLPTFSIEDESLIITIAESLFEIGRYGYVVQLLKDFHTRSNDLQSVNQALSLLSKSYRMIPGNEKKAELYQGIYNMRNKPA